MKRILVLITAILALSLLSFGQTYLTTPGIGGMVNAGEYNYGNPGSLAPPALTVFSGSTSTGTYTITLYSPTITLANHRQVALFGNTAVTSANIALPPFTIGNGAIQETVTSYTVSGCSNPNSGANQTGTCQINATFTYAHGRGDTIVSADGGWQEAMNDAANNGGGTVLFNIDCGVITLSTSGTTTTSSCLIPKSFTNLTGSVYVTTTITTSASYSVGISGATAAYVSSCTSLTAGKGCAYFQVSPTAVTGSAGTGDLLITTNATAGAGAVHVKVTGFSAAQSAF